MANTVAAPTTSLCQNCRVSPADQKTYYHELTHFQFISPFVVNRRGYGARGARMLVHSGTVSLCAECATRYLQASGMRALGNKIATWSFVGTLLGAIVCAVLSRTPLAGALWTLLLVLGTLAFAEGLILLAHAHLLSRTATRFLND
jgi:hypothetical protein